MEPIQKGTGIFMKIGIVCAADSELSPFLPMLDDCSMTEKSRLTFYEGRMEGI